MQHLKEPANPRSSDVAARQLELLQVGVRASGEHGCQLLSPLVRKLRIGQAQLLDLRVALQQPRCPQPELHDRVIIGQALLLQAWL